MFTQDTMLTYHLTHNHYPPLSAALVPFAQRAIDLARDERYDEAVRVNGATLRDGDRVTTVREVMDGMHLWSFIEEESDPDFCEDLADPDLIDRTEMVYGPDR